VTQVQVVVNLLRLASQVLQLLHPVLVRNLPTQAAVVAVQVAVPAVAVVAVQVVPAHQDPPLHLRVQVAQKSSLRHA